MKTPTWFDPDIKYPPFKGKLKLFKWVIQMRKLQKNPKNRYFYGIMSPLPAMY